MEDKFENIKNQFIVDEAEYPKDKLKRLMEIMLTFVRVGKDGQVVVIKKIPTRKILALILSARFVANKVDNNILDGLKREELKNYSYLDSKVFNSRLSELVKEGFTEGGKEEIRAKNILLVERFLEKLEEKENG